MGRPRAFDREQAVETVMNEIWRNGYEASSINALAEKIGITRSSLYHAFGDREQLFREVLERYLEAAPDRRLDQIGEGEAVAPAIVDTFAEVCRVRAADPEGRGCLVLNCVAELAAVNPALGELLGSQVRAGVKRFERLLRQAVRQGEIAAPGDIHAKALALQNLLIGINALSKVVRSEAELWRAARETLAGLGLGSVS